VHPLSFHSLRHTATSFLKSAGANNSTVMDLIGHQSTAVSAHYTTIDAQAKRRAINLMPDITA
jgi:integrase